jgi:hypothetical protein
MLYGHPESPNECVVIMRTTLNTCLLLAVLVIVSGPSADASCTSPVSASTSVVVCPAKLTKSFSPGV